MATKEQSKQSMGCEVEKSSRAFGLIRLLEGSSSFLLGGLCASAQLFGHCSPFGLALLVAAGTGVAGFCALGGVVLGYLFFEGVSGGLHYGAAAVLTFGVAFALYDSPLREKIWVMPTAAALLCGICRFIALQGTGFGTAEVIFFFTEPLIVFGTALMYQGAFPLQGEVRAFAQLDSGQKLGMLSLAATALIALSAVRFLGEFSLGRIVAAVVVMVLAKGGVQYGLLSGVLTGLCMDIASAHSPYYTMVYALAGAACGLCANRPKLYAALAYVMANGMAVLWTWESGIRVALLYEVFVASVLFFLLPRKLREQTGQMLALTAPKASPWEGARDSAVGHVKHCATAFHALYESLRESLRTQDAKGEDPASLFRRTAERECGSCKLRELCWQQEYQSTQQVLNEALRQMIPRGRGEGSDFPSFFRSRCIHFSKFLSTANEELTAYLYRRQYQGRMKESRGVLCQQYAEVERILAKAAVEIAVEFTPDLPREARLRQFLRGKGIDGYGRVYFDQEGHLRVETPSAAYLRTEHGRESLSSLLALSLRPAEEAPGGGLFFTQAEPFVATAGVFGRSKDGISVSGDTGTWFRREDGLLCILLCDGMGSGEAARQESGLAVRLLQNFLKAGVEPEAALRTVNTALSLRSQEEGGCTTVDLLTIELYTGLCSVYKLGAAPTYVRRSGKVSSIQGTALPAGLSSGEESKADISRFRAEAGDWILLLSDGLTGADSDAWLCSLLEGHEGNSPGELAEAVLIQSEGVCPVEDDRTVIAVRLDRR